MKDREKPVMLIVDECEVRCLLQDIYFSEFGMDVEWAIEGEAAVERCSALAPVVTLVSMSLEGRLGAIETIRGLKARCGTTIIALADAAIAPSDQLEEEALAAGADMLVVKPCMPEVLLRHVTRLLARPQPDLGSGVVAIDESLHELPGDSSVEVDETAPLDMIA